VRSGASDLEAENLSRRHSNAIFAALNQYRQSLALARLQPGLSAGIAASDEVQLTGEVNDKTKESFLASAAALLFPIDWPEPFGLVMIEAMACGTPSSPSDPARCRR